MINLRAGTAWTETNMLCRPGFEIQSWTPRQVRNLRGKRKVVLEGLGEELRGGRQEGI